MKIEWRLDMDEALDPENLVGDMMLNEAQTSLGERDTYIDSWLVALIAGLQALQTGQSIRVDIPEEPAPLVFAPVGKGAQISYQTMMLNVGSVEELQRAVYRAAQNLLQQLAAVEGREGNPLIRDIREFVCKARSISDVSER